METIIQRPIVTLEQNKNVKFEELVKLAKQIFEFINNSDKVSYLPPKFQKKGWI